MLLKEVRSDINEGSKGRGQEGTEESGEEERRKDRT
jgi:hypothetical protein